MIFIGVSAAILGLFIAFHIFAIQKHKKPLVCPRRMPNCDEVIASKYGTMFGVSNAALGILFYTVMVLQLVMIFTGLTFPLQLVFLKLVASGGFIFSLYLIYIQAFVLRRWCLWCIVSAMTTLTLFIIALSL